MNIAFLTHEPFFPPSGGGSAEALYLVKELVRRGHRLHIFCPAIENQKTVEDNAGVTIYPFTRWQMGRYTAFRNFKYLWFPTFQARQVLPFLKSESIELILSQHAISAVTAGRCKRQTGIRTVMNFLDYLTGFLETWPPFLAPRLLIRQMERYELSLPQRFSADGILTVSDTLADYFAQAGYPRARIRPIYYGYDSQLFPLSAVRGQSERQGKPLVVMHGSFDHHHLGVIALTGIAAAARAHPELRFRFIGKETPALKKFISQVRARHPGVQVECPGFVPYREVAAHLAEASIGIVPYEESTGTHCAFVAKIVEYLALGLCVVSTPLKSAVRYFGDEAQVKFTAFDGESFGRQIAAWLDTPMEQRLARGPEASERVRRQLDWQTISQRAAEFIETAR